MRTFVFILVAAQAHAAGKFDYFGGPVISNVRLYQVDFEVDSASAQQNRDRCCWPFATQCDQDLCTVDSNIKNGVNGFYGRFVAYWLDWMDEYNTFVPATAGSRMGMTGDPPQHIGSGRLINHYRIALPLVPSSARFVPLAQADVEQALANSINTPILGWDRPDDNTVYAIHFAKIYGVQDDVGRTLCSLASTAYPICGYHGSFALASGQRVRYVVVPSLEDCDSRACWSDIEVPNKPLARTTMVASHELMEAITDPDSTISVGSDFVYPTAWASNADSEIGDICAAMHLLPPAKLGGTSDYAEYVWSNKRGQCIAPIENSSFHCAMGGRAPVPVSMTVLVALAALAIRGRRRA